MHSKTISKIKLSYLEPKGKGQNSIKAISKTQGQVIKIMQSQHHVGIMTKKVSDKRKKGRLLRKFVARLPKKTKQAK